MQRACRDTAAVVTGSGHLRGVRQSVLTKLRDVDSPSRKEPRHSVIQRQYVTVRSLNEIVKLLEVVRVGSWCCLVAWPRGR